MKTQKAIFERNDLFQTIVVDIHVSFFWGAYLFISEYFNDIFPFFLNHLGIKERVMKICYHHRSEPKKNC